RRRRLSASSIARSTTARRRSTGSTSAARGVSCPIRSSSGGPDGRAVRVAIHQPHYLPWLGYFAKWAAADRFIFLDTVQYEKNGWQNRNRIKTSAGPRWLTVPVHVTLGTPIGAVGVDTAQPWRARHLRAIEDAYARALHLPRHRDALRRLYAAD